MAESEVAGESEAIVPDLYAAAESDRPGESAPADSDL